MSRLDKFLWSVRLYKTRGDAADSCKSGKVKVNGLEAKASKDVSEGDIIDVRKININYRYKVLALPKNRIPAKLVTDNITDLTPEEELAKLNVPKESVRIFRERGSGRPTKKERRDLDSLMELSPEENIGPQF